MKEANWTRISRLLSYLLRHRPDAVGVTLDANGWVNLDQFVAACNIHGFELTRKWILEVVRTDDKQRFALSEDGQSIRANQGHSVEVDLAYEEREPPEVLFHGTASYLVEVIMAEGLKKITRHHVHLSADPEMAERVGRRRGIPVVLRVLAAQMAADGCKFYLSANNVWLTDYVAPNYLVIPTHDLC